MLTLTLAPIGVLTSLMFGYATLHRFWLVSVITPLMIAISTGLNAALGSSRNGLITKDLWSL
jgi:hypothetical protein